MTYTTSVAFGLTLVIEIVLGLFYGGGEQDLAAVQQIIATLERDFTVGPWHLIPPILVIVCAYRKYPAIPGLVAGVLSAVILGVIFEGATYPGLLDVAYGGYASNTGIEAVDSLLSKGGLTSMLYAISIVICAMMFGGIMEETRQLKVIVDRILRLAKSDASLIVSTVLTCVGANLVLCDQYMAIVMGGRMYAQAYRERGLHPKNLSRAVEDSATVTANLVPWNSGGAYQAATLGGRHDRLSALQLLLLAVSPGHACCSAGPAGRSRQRTRPRSAKRSRRHPRNRTRRSMSRLAKIGLAMLLLGLAPGLSPRAQDKAAQSRLDPGRRDRPGRAEGLLRGGLPAVRDDRHAIGPAPTEPASRPMSARADRSPSSAASISIWPARWRASWASTSSRSTRAGPASSPRSRLAAATSSSAACR